MILKPCESKEFVCLAPLRYRVDRHPASGSDGAIAPIVARIAVVCCTSASLAVCSTRATPSDRDPENGGVGQSTNTLPDTFSRLAAATASSTRAIPATTTTRPSIAPVATTHIGYRRLTSTRKRKILCAGTTATATAARSSQTSIRCVYRPGDNNRRTASIRAGATATATATAEARVGLIQCREPTRPTGPTAARAAAS